MNGFPNLTGERGTVTVAVHGRDRPGEVEIRTSAGTQKLAAFSTEEIPLYASVIVYDVRPNGVEVTKA